MTQVDRKDPTLAAILSLFFPGLGHLYLGEVGKGIAYAIAAVIGYALFVIPGIAIHIFAIMDAYKVAKSGEDLIYEHEREEAHVAAQQQIRDNERRESLLDSNAFIERIEKVARLFHHDMLTEGEFRDRKVALISELARKRLDKDPEDFLYEVIRLKDSGALDEDDITRIKTIVL